MKLIDEEEIWAKIIKEDEDQLTYDRLDQMLEECSNHSQTEFKKHYLDLVSLICDLTGHEYEWIGSWGKHNVFYTCEQMHKILIKELMEWKNNG